MQSSLLELPRCEGGKDAKRLNPFGGAFGFEAELVEGCIVNQPVEGVCKFRHYDVRCFAFEVLGVRDSAYGSVEGGTAVAAGDYHRSAEVLAKGLKNFFAEVL